jgi:hypothetical protein
MEQMTEQQEVQEIVELSLEELDRAGGGLIIMIE